MAAVAAIAPGSPTLALRWGAVACALVLVFSLSQIRLRPADVYLFAYAVLVAASILWTIDNDASVLSMKNSAGALVIFLAVRTAGATQVGWRLISGGLVVGCCLLVYRLFSDNQLETISLALDTAGTRYGLENLNANYLSYSMATGAAVALVLAVWMGGRRHLILLVGVLAVLWVGIVPSGARGALIGVGLAALWLGVSRFSRLAPTLLKVVMLGLVAVALSIVTGLFQYVVQAFISPSLRERGDLNGRFGVWPAATDWWLAHFLLGSGAGTFPSVSAENMAAHNFVLDIGTGVGLIGVWLFGAVLYHSLWKDTIELPSRPALVGVYSLVSAPLLLSGFWIESPVFWVGLGLLGVAARSWRKSDGCAPGYGGLRIHRKPLAGQTGRFAGSDAVGLSVHADESGAAHLSGWPGLAGRMKVGRRSPVLPVGSL